MATHYRLRTDGADLFVRLTPKSSRDALEGAETTADGAAHVKARVRAVPEKGAANAALERLVARSLGVPASTVSVVAGGTSRLKTVRIAGEPAMLARLLDGLAVADGR
ncbi:MAG: DUF167 domain-containing protein [Rhizobiaceae bacterium]|nr:MAG: DUF167 domain-containing protein [Rhizobiaceae bacterium]CAG1001056.1 hypothetical protein RHIZO_02834 [Rhizobiaceae bacterium]